MGRLDNRVAVVTGSARGLGAGIARALANDGAVVVCADAIDAGPTAASLPASPDGRRAAAIRLDVTDTTSVDAAFAEVAREYGSLDILANNAGVAQPIADLIETPDEVVDRVFAVNVKGMIACCRRS